MWEGRISSSADGRVFSKIVLQLETVGEKRGGLKNEAFQKQCLFAEDMFDFFFQKPKREKFNISLQYPGELWTRLCEIPFSVISQASHQGFISPLV